ncbi:MAG TPA: CAP domain-containing protein [Gaiellaceae bacterium]|nr:CAP domain-containing protein [Gaiellaceae bacterium]
MATLALAPASPAATTLTQGERSLLAAVNGVRTNHGLRPLRVDATLTRAARSHSTTLLRRDVFTHGALGARLARAGARGPLFGENLAWGTGSRATARAIVSGWLRSPSHRANLLRPGWVRIGIGARTGTFMGHSGATVVTADFAGR